MLVCVFVLLEGREDGDFVDEGISNNTGDADAVDEVDEAEALEEKETSSSSSSPPSSFVRVTRSREFLCFRLLRYSPESRMLTREVPVKPVSGTVEEGE